ncbi:MAG: SUMF1/EgtB/PvdO family nonheme iron enzyme [Planctomycetota bacterium]
MQDLSTLRRSMLVPLGLLVGCASSSPHPGPAAPPPAEVDRERFPAFEQEVPGVRDAMGFVPVAVDGRVIHAGVTEVTWDHYDAFVFALDGDWLDQDGAPLARPSTPYINVDRGFGHRGWPALSVSLKGAQAFCAWLSSHSERSYRLPTRAEWQALARLPLPGDQVRETAAGRTRAVGAGAPNAWGVHDAYGNVAEWVRLETGRHALAGGSYQDPRSEVGPRALASWSADWNRSDPQVPKSVWWLADAPFAGFRVVCDAE